MNFYKNINFKKIKECTIGKKYRLNFVIAMLSYFFLILWINGLIGVIFEASLYDNYYRFVLITTSINSVLFGIILNLTIYRYREINVANSNDNFFSGFIIFLSFIFGGCPTCAVGFIPAILGSFGIVGGFFLSELFFVILQILTVVLFLISIFILQKNLVCGLRKPKK